MSGRITIAAAMLIASIAPAHAQRLTREVYRISEAGMSGKGAIEQTVIVYAVGESTRPKRFVAERLRTESDWCAARPREERCLLATTRSYGWVDSDTCPTLIAALDALGAIPIPPFAGTMGLTEFSLSHTSDLTIEGPPKFARPGANRRPPYTTLARVTVHGRVGFFRNWWDKSETALKPCWTSRTPFIDGKIVEAQLRAQYKF